MKKDTKFDNERQLLLLKKYYQVDEENKIISINVHYDKASDFNNELFETVAKEYVVGLNSELKLIFEKMNEI